MATVDDYFCIVWQRNRLSDLFNFFSMPSQYCDALVMLYCGYCDIALFTTIIIIIIIIIMRPCKVSGVITCPYRSRSCHNAPMQIVSW